MDAPCSVKMLLPMISLILSTVCLFFGGSSFHSLQYHRESPSKHLPNSVFGAVPFANCCVDRVSAQVQWSVDIPAVNGYIFISIGEVVLHNVMFFTFVIY